MTDKNKKIQKEEWMEQKVGGVEKRRGEHVFVQPAEGLRMDKNGNAAVQILAQPGDQVSVTLGNTFANPRWIKLEDVKENGIFSALIQKESLSGPQRLAFHVNGVEKLNVAMPMLYFANSLCNYVEFPDKETDNMIEARKGIEHGTVSHVFFYSDEFGEMISCTVYVPSGYIDGEDYPVLYFIHECGENRLAWTEAPRTNYLFDNLISDGMCIPFLVVEVDCTMSLAYHDQEDLFEGFGTQENFIIRECANYMETHFKVRKDKWGRAIAGIGLGAIQAGYIGLRNLDFFGYVGTFTAFWPSTDFHEHGKDDPIYTAVEELGKNPDRIRIFYRAEGDQDVHYDLIEKENELMEKLGITKIPGYSFEIHHGVEHSWGSYRRSFWKFLPKLFREKEFYRSSCT